MNAPTAPFEINRPLVARYIGLMYSGLILLTTIWVFGLGLVAAILYFAIIAPWLTVRQSEALQYWLDGSTLRVNSGVYFLKQKAIPLDRVTDIVLVQGPLMRYCGIWGVQIQTAGAGQQMPEATLLGLRNPEQVRDLLVQTRDDAAQRSRRSD